MSLLHTEFIKHILSYCLT